MPDLQTGKKESPTPDASKSTTGTSSCQEKTLVSNNAIFENINHIEVFDHCIHFKKRFSYVSSTPRDPVRRGKINHFSKRARFRLFTLLAKIENKLEFPPLFVTLTYHHGHENDPHSTKSQLHNFLVQLRNIDQGVQFIWRIELQKRGAPHYHLIIFPSLDTFPNSKVTYSLAVARLWHSIADPNSYRHKEFGCKVVQIRNYREACAYMSKYIAKVPADGADPIAGKHYGNSRNLPIKLQKTIGFFDDECKIFINKLILWMRENGKGKYADVDFMNIAHDFVVFIDRADFMKLISGEDFYFRDP